MIRNGVLLVIPLIPTEKEKEKKNSLGSETSPHIN